MRKLYLIKHALPEIMAGVPSRDWLLGAKGQRQAEQLADYFADKAPALVVVSQEAKARETGRILAEALNLPFSTFPGLHEHRRESTAWVADTARWEGMVQDFFRCPGELVFGEETADQAHQRFATAIAELMNQTQGDIAVACHGTVISLLISRANGLEPFGLWKRLGLPSVVVLEWPGLRLLEVLEHL